MFLNNWSRKAAVRFLIQGFPFLAGTAAHATTYYVSPTGNDASSGTTQAQAWATITRVNQLSYSLQPGDQVLFQRGGTYCGALLIASAGTAAQPITIGAYGSGAKPILTGAVPVTGWSNYQGSIWSAPMAQDVKYLFSGNESLTLARYPNSGWLRNETGSPSTLHDADLSQPSGYWTGAKAVIRTSNWSYHVADVTGFTGGTLTYVNTGYDLMNYSWGYYLCGKLSELDSPGEWYYDSAADQLYLWAPDSGNPNSMGIEAAVLPSGLTTGWTRHHMQVQAINFMRYTDACINLDINDHITVDNCRFEQCYQGVRAGGNNNTYTNNTFTNTFGTALFLMDDQITIENNTFTDIALQAGLGESGWGYFGIRTTGAGVVIRSNQLTNIGYIGIAAVQDALIEKNVIEAPLKIMNDGSGIAFDSCDGMIIQDNIVQNVVGDLTSSAPGSPFYEQMGHGIYFGNTSIKNTTVRRNTVSGCSGHGIHMDHTMVSQGNQVKNNTLFGNHVQFCASDISNISTPGATAPYYVPSYNDVVTGNIFYCTAQDQLCMKIYNCYGAVPVDFGTYDNNLYYNPYNELSTWYYNWAAAVQVYYTLEEWQVDRNKDWNSTRSPDHFNALNTVAEIGTNPILCGQFNTNANVNSWTVFPGNCTVARDFTYLDGGAMKAHMPNNSLYNEMVLNGPDQFPIVAGEWYRVRVSTESDVLGQVNFRIKGLTQMTGPYAAYERGVPFGPVRRDVEFYFQSNLTDQALIQLVSQYTDPTYWIDNLEVQHVTVAPIDPATQQTLLVNPTDAVANMGLTGCWSDLSGLLHSGGIDVTAFGSKVLVKEADADCALTTGIDNMSQAPDEPSGFHPNPVRSGALIFIPEATSVACTFTLYDPQGRVAYREASPAGTRNWIIPDHLTEGIYLADLAGENLHTVQRIAVER